VGLDQADGARWAIDHVFLDQDGIPTLVEIKRYPKISLSSIAADPDGDRKMREAFGWFARVVRAEIIPDDD